MSNLDVQAQGNDGGALQAYYVSGILSQNLTIINGSTVSVNANAANAISAVVGGLHDSGRHGNRS